MSSPRNSPEWRIFLIKFFLDSKQRNNRDVEYVTDLKSVPFQGRPCDLEIIYFSHLLQEDYQERALEDNFLKYL
jgi:hypothetical protein